MICWNSVPLWEFNWQQGGGTDVVIKRSRQIWDVFLYRTSVCWGITFKDEQQREIEDDS